MYQPLLELPAAPAPSLVSERLLGEAAGCLYGASRCAAFQRAGGAVYGAWCAASRDVVPRPPSAAAAAAASSLCAPRLSSALGALVRSAAALLPLLRLVLPKAVPTSPSGALTSATGAAAPLGSVASGPPAERVAAVAFHPHRALLAAVVDEGAGHSARVVVFDFAEGRELCALTHAFQRRASCVAWKPMSRDVLAVGCDGGALLWGLSFRSDRCALPHCLFYRCAARAAVTALAFSARDGRYMACGSAEHVAVQFHDVRHPPASAALMRSVALEGATREIFFADDDSFAVRLVSGAAAVVLVAFPSCEATTVHTSGPVLRMAKARALGPNHFFLHVANVEGVFVAHVNPFVGIEVIALVATGIDSGIGGRVRCMACSGRRLYLALETGHLLVCHYGRRDVFTLIPVGVAEMDAVELSVFEGFTHGSLLAVVESDQTISFVPSYHA